MDQKELRELENRCIEENPPWCQAACPLHVDARALCAAAAKEDWASGWKVLLRAMPLAGVLGRICDAPCRTKCKRAEAGGSIAVESLERACVEHAPPMRSVMPLPAKGKTVIVAGAGLAGLTAAWDLARKGYSVTVHEPGAALARALRKKLAHRVPEKVWEAELALLAKAGVKIELSAPVEREGFLEKCLAAGDAVILSLDALDPPHWPLMRDGRGGPLVPSPAQSTQIDGVFAAGLGGPDKASPVWQAAEGRWAATSADRFLQGVSATAGREKDLPHKTGLYTSLEGVKPEPEVISRGEVYTGGEAAQEAGRCLQCHCLECVKACPYLERFGAYPKKYAREIYNNQSIVMGSRLSNKLINSCSLCGLCEEVCPENFAMRDLCLAARREMVKKGKMPPSAHEFSLLDMQFSQGPDFMLARHQPGHKSSSHLFFPGCQLAASAPDKVHLAYDRLCATLPGGVGLMLGCCGAPAHWAGQKDMLRRALAQWHRDWLALGSPPVIMACTSCADIFRRSLPEVKLEMLWQVLLAGESGGRAETSGPLAMHDPCTARHDPQTRDAVRGLMGRYGVSLEELALGRELTECCGYGGLMENANPDLAREVISRRAGQSPLDYLTYCAVCRDRLASAGKRALHVLDVIFPDKAGPDPADRPGPGWSQRRENRARLKAGLLRELWGEKPAAQEEHRMLKLVMTEEVRELLEKRRILDEDIQKVIQQAETSGQKLTHPETGHFLASHQPYKAVFWVEYSPAGQGFNVHNAYSHRMVVKGAGK